MIFKKIINFYLYNKAISELNKFYVPAIVKNKQHPIEKLQFMENFLEHHGLNNNVLKNLNIIHIAGTKGKGSVSSMIECILRGYGLKTGLYTSPHIIETRERIKINGVNLSYHDFAKYFFHIFNSDNKYIIRNKDYISQFNALTLLAFYIFIKENVDIAIFEVGIGGKFDCTNVIKNPLASVITTIDYDHMDILGNTIKEIAENKTGIIKNNSPVYTHENQCSEAMEVIEIESILKSAKLKITTKDISDNYIYQTNMNGEHQIMNAKLSCNICKDILGLKFDKELPHRFKNAINNVNLLGRCQKIIFKNIKFYLDGCHTPLSFEASINWFIYEIKNFEMSHKFVLVFNLTKDRDYQSFLKKLSIINFSDIIFTNNISGVIQPYMEPEYPNTVSSAVTNEKLNKYLKYSKSIFPTSTQINITSNASETLSYIFEKYQGDEEKTHVLIVGSLYLVGSFLRIFTF